MNTPDQYVVMSLDEQRYALPLAVVKRVVRVVEVSALPKTPPVILGVINVEGAVIPVINLRRRFRLPEREARLSDQLVVAATGQQTVAIWVDAVIGVVERAPSEIVSAERIFPGLDYLKSVAKLTDGMMFIQDLGTFLTGEEEEALRAAVRSGS